MAGLRYVETSGLLAALLESEAEAMRALHEDRQFAASALTLAEAARALVRARLAGRLSPTQEEVVKIDLRAFERRCSLVPISNEVLARVGEPFPVEPVRTLDAIHLVSAQMLGEPPHRVSLFTRDRRVRANAQALRFQVL